MNFSFVRLTGARILGRCYAIPASGWMQNDYKCSVPSTTLTVRELKRPVRNICSLVHKPAPIQNR
jgi:hypothetical protein